MKTHSRLINTIILFLLAIVLLVTLGLLIANSVPPRSYECHIESIDQVYDGDTIRDCKIFIAGTVGDEHGEVWPGIIIEDNALWVVTDLRIAGIDTPERRPSTRHRDGTRRSEQSRDNERYAAEQSRQALIKLLTSNDYEFQIVDPEQGKYAGRIVGRCIVDDTDAGKYLIERGYALPYDGGTKVELDWNKLDKGFIR